VTDSATFTTPEASDEDLGDLLLEVLPPDGSTIGNMSAREALGRVAGRQISEEEYEAVKDKALSLGLVVKGRGGSIGLVIKTHGHIKGKKRKYVNHSKWITRLDTPCSLLMPCNTCGELQTPLDFHQTTSNSRTDALGIGRITKCRNCSADSYRSLSQQRKLYLFAKQRAKQKKLEFSITEEDIAIPARCPILDIPLAAGSGRNGSASAENHNAPTIDRIDNSIGYTKENIAVISRRANTLKKDASLNELVAVLVYMRNYSHGREDSVAIIPAIEGHTASRILALRA
jgi:hypothetical protein